MLHRLIPPTPQDSEDNLTGLSLQSMATQEIFRNVISGEVMCGILRWQLQFTCTEAHLFWTFPRRSKRFLPTRFKNQF